MDLIKELQYAKENGFSIEKSLSLLKEEQTEINKKVHIFKIINLAEKLEQLVQSEQLISKDMSKMVMTYYINLDEYNNQFSIHFLNKSGVRIRASKLDDNFPGVYEKINLLLKDLIGIDIEYSDRIWKDYGWADVPINENIKDTILELFLTKDLIKILEFSKMSVEIDAKDGSQKKLKI